MLSIAVLSALSAAGAAAASPTTAATSFSTWRTARGKTYPSAAEAARREAIFNDNARIVAELNADPTDMASYELGKFADMLPSEIPRSPKRRQENDGEEATLTAAAAAGSPNECTDPFGCVYTGICYSCKRFPAFGTGPLPTHIDWTELGAVTPVKDQGKCGNCFTFSVAGDIEGTNFLAGKPLISLSEQQLTSCDRDGDDGGCAGSATVLDTFKYVQENGGIASEFLYPTCSSNYTCGVPATCDPEDPEESKTCKKARKDGVCNKLLEKRVVANISGYYQVSGGVKHWGTGLPLPVNETALMEALVKAGPISIAVNSKYFDNYKKGVLSKAKCKGGLNGLDHQVLMVVRMSPRRFCVAIFIRTPDNSLPRQARDKCKGKRIQMVLFRVGLWRGWFDTLLEDQEQLGV